MSIHLDSNKIQFFISTDYYEHYKKHGIEINNQSRFIILIDKVEHDRKLHDLIMENINEQFYTIDYVDNVKYNLTFKGAINYIENDILYRELVFEI